MVKINTKGLDFKHKEVININDARRLRIRSRCDSRVRNRPHYFYYCSSEIATNYLDFWLLGNDITIPWENITCIGEDIILVKY